MDSLLVFRDSIGAFVRDELHSQTKNFERNYGMKILTQRNLFDSECLHIFHVLIMLVVCCSRGCCCCCLGDCLHEVSYPQSFNSNLKSNGVDSDVSSWIYSYFFNSRNLRVTVIVIVLCAQRV